VLMQTIAKLLLVAMLLFFPLRLLAADSPWQEYPAGEVTFQAPTDWRLTQESDTDGQLFVSPDGQSTLLARWWADASGRSDREAIVSNQLVVADGRPAQLLHLQGDGRESLKLVLKTPAASDRTFTLTLTRSNEDFSNGSSLFREMIKRLRFSQPAAQDGPSIGDAEQSAQSVSLGQKLGQECRPVALDSWQHRARTTIQQRKGVHLQWVQRCGDHGYPVFGAEFDYDPQGQTSDFFHPLFVDALAANQGQSLAFVAIRDRLLIQVRQLGPDQYDFNYAELDNPAAAIWKLPPRAAKGE